MVNHSNLTFKTMQNDHAS